MTREAPPPARAKPQSPAAHLAIPAAVAALLALAHLATIANYGIFRDEFYYLACGRHLAWGYVDHPPLVGLLARAGTGALGSGSLGIRWLAVLSGVLTILATGLIVRRLGGGRLAQLLAALSVALAPHYLFVFHVLSMNGPEILLWTLGGLAVLAAVRDQSRAAWIAFGVVCGIGLLNKHSMLVFGLGIGVGLLATPARRQLRTPWPWFAGAIAGVMFAPHLWWQVRHGWPTLEFIRNAQAEKIADIAPLTFLTEQVLMMNPGTLPVWIAGLVSCLLGRRRPETRVLGVAFLVVLGVFLLQKSKPYYLTPIYPLLFAPGAVALEQWSARRNWARWAVPAGIVAVGVLVAPLAWPVLPVDRFLSYSRTLGVAPTSQERHEMGALPQHYADMFGWEELARTISRVYTGLPEAERATARVFATNYGQAGALEYYAARYALPPVVSPHNNYWYWGPGAEDGGTLIIIGGRREDHLQAFEQVEEVARTACTLCMPYENDRPIYVGRGWRVSLKAIWPREKRFI
jgi:hypothetical protein